MLSTDIANTARLRAFALYRILAVFVALCLSIDFGTEFPLNYWGKTRSFIVGHNAFEYYFATSHRCKHRLLCSLLLESAMLLGNEARNSQQRRNTLVNYVRLTSLMEFTWLIGFLVKVHALYFLWYPFTELPTPGFAMCDIIDAEREAKPRPAPSGKCTRGALSLLLEGLRGTSP